MWIIYALAAALLWGINYAVSGKLLQGGLSVATLAFLSFGTGTLVLAILILGAGGPPRVVTEIAGLGKNMLWLYVAIIASTAAAILTFFAIEEKNATIASLIEISYPFFVALFSWLFFRETEWNLPTLLGGGIIVSGVILVFLGNK